MGEGIGEGGGIKERAAKLMKDNIGKIEEKLRAKGYRVEGKEKREELVGKLKGVEEKYREQIERLDKKLGEIGDSAMEGLMKEMGRLDGSVGSVERSFRYIEGSKELGGESINKEELGRISEAVVKGEYYKGRSDEEIVKELRGKLKKGLGKRCEEAVKGEGVLERSRSRRAGGRASAGSGRICKGISRSIACKQVYESI
ncbi:MAG: hypothetical protein LBG23_04935 [Endomicrobium sp.]|nr:hypothetical protein [Endomicrobium sp.]